MSRSRRIFAGVLLLVAGTSLQAQTSRALVLFKDGYSIEGKVVEKRDWFVDPASGAGFTIPAGGAVLYLDDDVRRITFTPSQIQEVIVRKQGDLPDLLTVVRYGSRQVGNYFLPGWQVQSFGNWNDRCERNVKVDTGRGILDMTQRLTYLSPKTMALISMGYKWDMFYFPEEVGTRAIRGLLVAHFAKQKDLTEPQRRHKIATFFYQAGWYEDADREYEALAGEFPNEKKDAEAKRESIRNVQADLFVKDILQAHQAGRTELVKEWLGRFERQDYASKVAPRNRLVVQDLRNKYDALEDKLVQARDLLEKLPELAATADRPFWTEVAAALQEELCVDTLPRLDTFLVYGANLLRDMKEGRRPSEGPERVLALAATGWLLGNTAAEPDVARAVRLWKTRKMVLDYQKTDGAFLRGQMLADFLKKNEVNVDVLARIIRQLPPPVPHDKLGTEMQKLEIGVGDSVDAGSYLVQLPPGYRHNRPYPVLLALHGQRESAEQMMERIGEHAAKRGYILAAPLWGSRSGYTYQPSEHAIVLNTLRDLRRRFQVDSDRVFLFGWEIGGDFAYDVALAHPDQFAGLCMMNGTPRFYVQRCWTNAQYLPIYAIEGDMNGVGAKANRGMTKDLVRARYPCLYVEYKGRFSEWFSAEIPKMFDWIGRKQRMHPAKELGRYHTGGGSGEEFRTMRAGENRFYWLEIDEVNPRCLNDARRWVHRVLPAWVQASVAVGNELDVRGKVVVDPKTDQKKLATIVKGAKIWTQVNIRTNGVERLTLNVSPTMHDFDRPLLVRLNSTQIGNPRTIVPSAETLLEDFRRHGDRQRLVYAKIELRP